jgi:hypothetical protein
MFIFGYPPENGFVVSKEQQNETGKHRFFQKPYTFLRMYYFEII